LNRKDYLKFDQNWAKIIKTYSVNILENNIVFCCSWRPTARQRVVRRLLAAALLRPSLRRPNGQPHVRRQLLAVGWNPTVQREPHWVKTTPRSGETLAPISPLARSVCSARGGGWRWPSPRGWLAAGASPATAAPPQRRGVAFPASPDSFSVRSMAAAGSRCGVVELFLFSHLGVAPAATYDGGSAGVLPPPFPFPLGSEETAPLPLPCAGDALQAARWCALCPRRGLSFRPWRRRAPPLPMFFDLCLGMPMRTWSRGTARPETAAQLCRRTQGSGPVRSFPFLLDLLLGIWWCGISG
jgi:hypothetical protein